MILQVLLRQLTCSELGCAQNSCNFVSQSHRVWVLPPGQKKPSKRFGTCVASPAKSLNDLLVKHQAEVEAFILGKLGVSGMAEGQRHG